MEKGVNLPSPLAGEGPGVRGPRRQARVARRLTSPAPHPRLRRHLLPTRGEGALMRPALLPQFSPPSSPSSLLLAGPARADEADKGVLAEPHLAGPVLAVDERVGRRGRGRAVVRLHDQRHRAFRPRRAVAEDRQGQADLEPARAAQPAARGRSADDRAYAGASPPPALRTPPPPDAGPPQPILPELPLKVIVKEFAIDGTCRSASRSSASRRASTIDGRATLGPPSEGLDLSLDARSGSTRAANSRRCSAYVPQTDKLTVSIEFRGAGGRHLRPSRQPPGPAAGEVQPSRGPARSTISTPNSTSRPARTCGRKGDVAVARQGAGRQADPRPQLPARRHDAADPPAGVRRRDDAQGRRPVQRRFQHRRRPACISSPPTPGSTSRAGRSADDTLDIRIHAGAIPGSTEIGKLDLNATIAGPASAPDDRRRLRRRRHPRGGGLARARLGDLPRASERRADRRGDANRVRRPGSRQRPRAGRSGAGPGGRPRFHADRARLGGGGRSGDVRHARSRRAEVRGAIFGPARVPQRCTAGCISPRATSAASPDLRAASSRAKRASRPISTARPATASCSATIDAHATKLVTSYPILDKATRGRTRR